MSEGRLLVLGACMKQDKQFRARHIVESTGISRQLVNHHLKQLVDEGLLVKQDVYYWIPEGSDLIQELLDIRLDKSKSRRINSKCRLLDTDVIEGINNRIDAYHALKTLSFPNTNDLRLNILNEIKEAIETLESGRKYLNNAQISQNSARKRLLELRAESVWKNLGSLLNISEDAFGVWWDQRIEVGNED